MSSPRGVRLSAPRAAGTDRAVSLGIGLDENENRNQPNRRLPMIRNAIFGFSILALSAGSAFAGVKHHASKPVVVAEASAPAADTAAPAGDATEKKAKKSTKSTKKENAAKGEGKSEGAKEIKAPAPAAVPAPATK
jgi:hypothetical protein